MTLKNSLQRETAQPLWVHVASSTEISKGSAEFQWCFKVLLKDRLGEEKAGYYGLCWHLNLLGSSRTNHHDGVKQKRSTAEAKAGSIERWTHCLYSALKCRMKEAAQVMFLPHIHPLGEELSDELLTRTPLIISNFSTIQSSLEAATVYKTGL